MYGSHFDQFLRAESALYTKEHTSILNKDVSLFQRQLRPSGMARANSLGAFIILLKHYMYLYQEYYLLLLIYMHNKYWEPSPMLSANLIISTCT